MKQLKIISIVWGILLFLIFAALTIFALKWKSKTTPYFELESKLVSATKSYYETKYSYPNYGESQKVLASELLDNNQIESLKANDDECKGYVLVTHKSVIEYKAYIKCNNYMTKGYEDINENYN